MRVSEESEDCLYLNVWTATLNPGVRQLVMVWVYGGGNLGGAGSEDATDGSHLAAKGVVVVSFNYGLGALDYLAHPDIGANFGVQDQIAVLRWVQRNIAWFGGAASNVIVFGESVGAVAVHTLLGCPMARDLFHRAVIQSLGFELPAFAESWSYARVQQAAEVLFDLFGTRNIEMLRAVTIRDIKLASHELSGVAPVSGKVHTPADLVWMPVVDSKIVFEADYANLPEDIPPMLGCVENEARYFLSTRLHSIAMFWTAWPTFCADLPRTRSCRALTAQVSRLTKSLISWFPQRSGPSLRSRWCGGWLWRPGVSTIIDSTGSRRVRLRPENSPNTLQRFDMCSATCQAMERTTMSTVMFQIGCRTPGPLLLSVACLRARWLGPTIDPKTERVC